MGTNKKKKNKETIPPIVRLSFNKGDLIIKEGDYGLSIYEIIEGKVSIYSQTKAIITELATLGPGEIFGEMAFLTGNSEPRAASARAAEDTILDAWHPKKLTKEYGEMPPIIKYIVNQTLGRLVRINKFISEFDVEQAHRNKPGGKNPWDKKRGGYRKSLDMPCTYRPLSAPGKVRLRGLVRDVSKSGAQIEVGDSNFTHIPHSSGDTLVVHTVIPPDRDVELTGKIIYLKRREGAPGYKLGISFVRLSEDAKRKLGFFLMPSQETKSEKPPIQFHWP